MRAHVFLTHNMASLEDQFVDSIDNNLLKNNNIDSEKWIPLSLTLVEYPKGDVVGLFLALVSLMPFAIIAGFITLVLFRRDLHTIFFFIGVVINDVVGLFLKYTIREARPMRRDVVYVEYGMPSAHSQFMWFFAAYTTAFVCIRMHHNSNSTVSEKVWRWAIVGGCVSLASLVTYSRIYLHYHTVSQVVWGMIIGIIMGIIWFAVIHLVFTPYFPVIVTWKTSEFMLLRDTTLIPNVLWFEYTNIRTETRARSRKLVSMKSQ